MVAWRYEISSSRFEKYSFAALTHENIFFNTRREISYLRAAM